ncbi:MAG: hypothetical protein AABX11_06570 [Nanoarchaeota archaeon]
MIEREKIIIELDPSRLKIGQVIHIPDRCGIEGKVVTTPIIGYGIKVIAGNIEGKENLVGKVVSYDTALFASVRRGQDIMLTCTQIQEGDFYLDEEKARIGARFLKVKLDDLSWKIAIGDRTENKNSPYSIKNCNLKECCAEISEARNILYLCKNEGGLIVHHRDELANLLIAHGTMKYESDSPIVKVFSQLEINPQDLRLK